MSPETSRATLRVTALRGGTVSEITTFLTDFETAYVQLYAFDRIWFARLPTHRMFLRDVFLDMDFGLFWSSAARLKQTPPLSILPPDRVLVSRISVHSPGFWEFVASLNPLQQIREYLNERHKRRQDREYRELSERQRLELENELVQRQIWEKDNAILRDRLQILRDFGYSEDEIRDVVWSTVGEPLAQLGRHQDAKIIQTAELKPTKVKATRPIRSKKKPS